MIDRMIGAYIAKSNKSILLLGPRQVGKSTLVKSLRPDLALNFANEMTLLEHASNPGAIHSLVERHKPKVMFIDEIQKLPSVLNTVQSLIDERKIKFYLTGSSARKLRRGGANLLPGRVLNCNLGPIVFKELDYSVQVENALKYGSLPEVLTTHQNQNKEDLLESYASNYLKEEIKAEALTKSLESFARFLHEVVHCVGQFIDYTKLAKRAKISRHTCPNYFEILEDTLLAYRIFPDRELIERADLVRHPKFYFFDNGVLNGLVRNFAIPYERIGILSEQLAFTQILHSAQAMRKKLEVFSFRTRGGLEVDLLIKLNSIYHAIEIKYSDNLNEHDVSPLLKMKNYLPKCQLALFHMGRKEIKIDGVWCMPLVQGLQSIGL